MEVTFWGVRGSVPSPMSRQNFYKRLQDLLRRVTPDDLHDDSTIRTFVRNQKETPLLYGGNTTCMSIESERHMVIFDAGTGIRELGKKHAARKSFLILFTHLHHDHNQGLPFFIPLFNPNAHLWMYSPVILGITLQEAISNEMDSPFFPYELKDTMSHKTIGELNNRASIRLLDIETDDDFKEVFYDNWKNMKKEFTTKNGELLPVHVIADFHDPKLHKEAIRINILENLTHPKNGSFIYKIIEHKTGKTVVFATDTEGLSGGDQRLIRFAKDTSVLIHDAQYNNEEYADPTFPKQRYGHSTYDQAVEVALKARAKTLILTHHDPEHDEYFLSKHLRYTKELSVRMAEALGIPQEKQPQIAMAQEGMRLRL